MPDPVSPALSTLIVTVDGPGGTGKSTVSRLVADRAGLPHLDTGAYYRAATAAVLRSGVHPSDADAVVEVVSASGLDQEEGRMFLDGEDVSEEIRGEDVTRAVSAVSSHSGVRGLLVEMQRSWISRHGGRGVVEGRDIGSVVFPEAEVKIYLDASAEVRARRRAFQTGEDPEEVLADLNRRDHLDSTRAVSPLTVPDGAVVIDTSEMSLDEVVDRVLDVIASKS